MRLSASGGGARALALVVTTVTGACVGSGEGVPPPGAAQGEAPRTYKEIEQKILVPACARPCHHGGAAPKGLSLEANRALKQLVGVASVEVPGMPRVAPGKPDQSYLIAKVASADPRRVGSRMPRNGPPFLSFSQVRSLRLWIAAGASPDWQLKENELDAGGPVVDVRYDTEADATAAGPADTLAGAATDTLADTATRLAADATGAASDAAIADAAGRAKATP